MSYCLDQSELSRRWNALCVMTHKHPDSGKTGCGMVRVSRVETRKPKSAIANLGIPVVSQIMERILRVLLVEDAPFLRYAFSRLLRMQGYDVKEANDGQDALECLTCFQPDLILTDLMMPIMGGVELITHIRANPTYAEVPVVAITADATEQAEQAARNAGAVAVITKPIDLPALLDRLKLLVS